MKLVTFRGKNDNLLVGAVSGDKVIDLREGAEAHGKFIFMNMIHFISKMPESQNTAQSIIDSVLSAGPETSIYNLSEIELMAPVPRPLSIRDFMVFADHLANAMHTMAGWVFPPAKWINGACRKIFGKRLLKPSALFYEIPAYYKGNPNTVIGHEKDIIWPAYEEKVDYELEFGIYIGKQGRDITVRNAADYIAGYTVFNDVSARLTQFREIKQRLGPAKGKDFDTGNVMGPYLVTPEEVRDPYNLEMTARINGEEWSRGNSRDMSYTFEEIINYVSRSETLFPGEFFGSGTVPTGCGLELDRWIKPRDIIELEVEKLGILRNRIVKS